MTNQPSDLTLTSATGTVRRLQALITAGWPPPILSAELLAGRTEAARLLRARRVAVRTARRVADLYDRLWDIDPAAHGATQEAIRRAKARAEAARWAPATAWDDDRIDDPCAVPDWTGHCGTTKGVDLHHRHDIPLCPPCRAAINRRRLRNEARERRALSAAHA
ncbi:MAG: hypothetical protein AUG49_10585 [Catenulispora sp. 13_1_20CM_3_70_7]|nr:MAG: hypothetical protein AUG49_10585 [Catenulispora sp. 13_1_20CM_3_70_7]